MVDTIQLDKREGESLLDYHKRLIYGKLVDKTLADADYSELAERIYGQTYASDVARRMLYGSRRTLEMIDKMRADDIKDIEVATEIDNKMIELKKERQKFFDQRREFSKLVNEDGRRDHLYDTLADAANNLGQTVGVMFNNDLDIAGTCTSENEAVLVFSDWHYGMTTSNAFNVYNIEVCKRRVKSVVESSIARIVHHGCSKLHVVILGDAVHGAIHTSARVASEELVCDQLMQVSEILAQSIERLGQFVNEVYVYSTYGNHGRTVPNKNDNIHRDNMERIIPWWLEQRLKIHSNITVVNDSIYEFLFINAAGHEICAVHGDLDGAKSSPRLVSTLFSKQYGKNIEYVLLGDKHHRESFEELGITSMICGALCGADDYANDKRLYSSPSQLLLIVNPNIGVDAEYRIACC